jgi:acyl-CoA hydrolase
MNDNPAIEFHPSDYVNDPAIIARHNKMVSMSVAMTIDLTGQVASDALPYNHFSGVNGIAHPVFREELFFEAKKMGLLIQHKGLGKTLMQKLASAARDNGIAGLIAYTSTQNRGIIKLFNTLPYKTNSYFNGDVLNLSAKFDEPEEQ